MGYCVSNIISWLRGLLSWCFIHERVIEVNKSFKWMNHSCSLPCTDSYSLKSDPCKPYYCFGTLFLLFKDISRVAVSTVKEHVIGWMYLIPLTEWDLVLNLTIILYELGHIIQIELKELVNEHYDRTCRSWVEWMTETWFIQFRCAFCWSNKMRRGRSHAKKKM